MHQTFRAEWISSVVGWNIVINTESNAGCVERLLKVVGTNAWSRFGA